MKKLEKDSNDKYHFLILRKTDSHITSSATSVIPGFQPADQFELDPADVFRIVNLSVTDGKIACGHRIAIIRTETALGQFAFGHIETLQRRPKFIHFSNCDSF